MTVFHNQSSKLQKISSLTICNELSSLTRLLQQSRYPVWQWCSTQIWKIVIQEDIGNKKVTQCNKVQPWPSNFFAEISIKIRGLQLDLIKHTYIRPVPQSVTCSSKAKSGWLRKEEAFQDLTCPLFLFWNECTLSIDKYSGEEKKEKEQGVKKKSKVE